MTNSGTKPGTILITAPMGFQLTPLSRIIGRYKLVRQGGLECRESRFLGARVLLLKSGFGRDDSVESITKALQLFKPDHLLCTGVAGALQAEYQVGDPFFISSASIWRGDSTTLSINQALGLNIEYTNTEMPRVLRNKGGRRVRRARLLSVDAIVNTVREKRKLGLAGFDLVDMEFAAVAAALKSASVSFEALMTISDTMHHSFPGFSPGFQGGHGHHAPPKLKMNMKKATQSLGSFVHLWLRSLLRAEQISD